MRRSMCLAALAAAIAAGCATEPVQDLGAAGAVSQGRTAAGLTARSDAIQPATPDAIEAARSDSAEPVSADAGDSAVPTDAEVSPDLVVDAKDPAPGSQVRCREMLRTGSNVIMTYCMTVDDWKIFERRQAEQAQAMLRALRGETY